MKRSFSLITALAALTLAGCGLGPGDNSFTGSYLRPVEVREVVTNADGTTDTYVTRISYDQDVLVSGEVTTKGGFPYRELKDFKREFNDNGDLVMTRTRVLTDANGVSVSQTLVSTHGDSYDQSWLETFFEVFTTDETPQCIETRQVEYNDNRYSRYEAWTPEGGTVLRTGYNYSSASRPTLTYQEINRKDGATVSEVNMGLKSVLWGGDQYNPVEYELYRNIPSLDSWNGNDGELIEAKTDYKAEQGGVESWTVYKYDGQFDEDNKPVPVTTSKVTVRSQNITVSW